MQRRDEMASGVTVDERRGYVFGIGVSQPEIPYVCYDPDGFNNQECTAQSWLPEPPAPWFDVHARHGPWTQNMSVPPLMAQRYYPHLEFTSKSATRPDPPFQIPFGYELDCQYETRMPQLPRQQEYSNPVLDEANFFQVYEKQDSLAELVIRERSPVLTLSEGKHSTISLAQSTRVTSSPSTSFGLSLDWSASSPDSTEDHTHTESPREVWAPTKRKCSSLDPIVKKPRQKSPTPNSAISSFVVVFENAPGALSTVKHRRKLDVPVRKAARAVRKAGACHQCRFRKRTCSIGTPCTSCLRLGNGLHELKCQRESPFVGKRMSEYFEFSSTQRCVSFNIVLPSSTILSPSASPIEWIEVDGIGTVSSPIRLRAIRKALNSFSSEDLELINGTRSPRRFSKSSSPAITSVLILSTCPILSAELEAWAISYTSKFIHAAGPQFESTTMAFILGSAWVSKKLPEHELVACMIKVASLSFVLRAGVKYTTTTTTNGFQTQHRTIEAAIDTFLYNSLRTAETTLFTHLQRRIFRTAGTLARQQIYPVALVLFQLLRLSCLASSHLSNISQRFPHRRHRVDREAEHQLSMMKLVLSTHLALFRSSNLLLIDIGKEENRDLVGNDDEIVELAGRMRDVVEAFREGRLRRKMKGSLAFRKEYFEMFRSIYDGL